MRKAMFQLCFKVMLSRDESSSYNSISFAKFCRTVNLWERNLLRDSFRYNYRATALHKQSKKRQVAARC